MPDIPATFSKLDERHGLPIAGAAVASLAAFILSFKDGFHLANQTLMVSGMFFFIACALDTWRNRHLPSVSYVGETESIWEKMSYVSRSLLPLLVCCGLSLAFAYLAWTGDRLPGN